VARGLRAIGAGTIQAFQFGLWPHAKPLIWSHALWMLEYNIRSATIIGYVGAGGIGSRLHEYQEYGRMDRFGMVILVILVVVTLLDFLGEWIRTRIKRRTRLRSIADT
jgi:phosphonate transport system permease protein